MSNVFDSYKALTFDQISETMGYDAFCDGVYARVLFNHPSVKEEVGAHAYDFERPTLEFKIKDWPGVKERIEAKENVKIAIEDVDYWALKIIGDRNIAHDGETYKVFLEKDSENEEEE